METGKGIFLKVESILKEEAKRNPKLTYKVNKTDIAIGICGVRNLAADIYGRASSIRVYVNSKDNSPEYQAYLKYIRPYTDLTRNKIEPEKFLDFSFYIEEGQLEKLLPYIVNARNQ